MIYRCLLMFSTFLPCALLAQEPYSCKGVDDIAGMEMIRARGKLQFRSNLLTQNYDLKYHRLEWEIDPAVHYIAGTITSYFIPTESEFDHISFDLEDNMQVNNVLYHGISVPHTHADHTVQITLPGKVMPGVLDSISVQYEGAPVSDGFGSFETGVHDSIPLLWTLSEPYGAFTWWPCKQDLVDKIDSIDIFVTTQSHYKVGTNGILANQIDHGDGRKTYHWRHRYPIATYLISLAVTNYAEFTDYAYLADGDSIPILNYVFPEKLELAEVQLAETVGMMELFNELFGTYPFAKEKYGHAQFGWGGGMEHQTMSSMGAFPFHLQAHELAHQWFGDKVTCGSWRDIWLNEGFASYATALTYEHILAGTVYWRLWREQTIEDVTEQADGSVWVSDTTSVSRIFSSRLSYKKGAMLLHMLRWLMGDDDFYQALRNYLEDPELAYGFARTKDLQSHLEAVYGQDLSEFFQDWFYGEGYPSYHIQFEPKQGGGAGIFVTQTTSHPSVDFYEMKLPIWVSDGNQDTLLILDHVFNGQAFAIDLAFEPDTLVFDPELWILSAGNTINGVTGTLDPGEISSAIDLYPVPAGDRIFMVIRNEAFIGQIRTIYLTDPLGSILQECNIEDLERGLDVTGLPAGTYFLLFQTRQGASAKRFIKQ